MATTPKLFNRSTPRGLVNVYTAATGTTAILTNVVIYNQGTAATTFEIWVNGYPIFYQSDIASKATVIVDMKQVLNGSDNNNNKLWIGSANNECTFHLSGVEIS